LQISEEVYHRRGLSETAVAVAVHRYVEEEEDEAVRNALKDMQVSHKPALGNVTRPTFRDRRISISWHVACRPSVGHNPFVTLRVLMSVRQGALSGLCEPPEVIEVPAPLPGDRFLEVLRPFVPVLRAARQDSAGKVTGAHTTITP
jgi:hypothetical protein